VPGQDRQIVKAPWLYKAKFYLTETWIQFERGWIFCYENINLNLTFYTEYVNLNLLYLSGIQ